MADQELAELQARIAALQASLQAKAKVEASRIAEMEKRIKTRVKFIVGGIRYETSRAVIAGYPDSMLESLISGRHQVTTDDDGSIFVDRDGEMFRHVLNAVRVGRLILPNDFREFDLLAEEFDYYGLPFQVDRAATTCADFTRTELVKLLSRRADYDFLGVRFCGLDLTNVRFDNGQTVRNLTKADFSRALLDFVVFPSSRGQSMQFTTFRGSNGKQISFASVNLSNAEFVKCSFVECDFSSAVLTRARFEDCDLTGSKFPSTNLSQVEFVRCKVEKCVFTGANFSAARIVETDFGTADCTGATNLPPLTKQ